MTQEQVTSEHIKQLALNEGFDLVRITKPEIPENAKIRYEQWLKQGFAAKMEYLHKNTELRFNPSVIFENTRSVLVLGLSYFTKDLPDLDYSISKYALGRDYHKHIKAKLKKLTRRLKEDIPGLSARPYVDSAPVLERSLALQSGMGWIGKNTCLINKKQGSFIFLAELFLNIELTVDEPYDKNYCGNCTRCIDACPTQALSKSGLNANLCISYHNIENPESIPPDIISAMDNQLFGCDICQDICPWNQRLVPHRHEDLFPKKHLGYLTLECLSDMNEESFKKEFAGTPFLRAGREKLIETMKQLLQKK